MVEAVIVEAVRTPIARRGGAYASVKAVELLGAVLVDVIARAGIEASAVEQVIGGCVTQIGEQGLNVTRNAWLDRGLDPRTGCTTVDVSCGSAQQANHLVAALIAAGAIDVGIACGVETMGRVPAGANVPDGHDAYKTHRYPHDDPPHLQFGGAERIAGREGLSRAHLDAYGLRSQTLAARAWAEGRFARELTVVGDDGPLLTRDEGLRPTTLAALAELPPAMRGGRHTAGTISQVSDGAAAVLWMSADRARALGLAARGHLSHQVVTGADPYYLLDGPVAATEAVLDRAGMTIDDVDLFEVNEAFAAVVLSWLHHTKAPPERVNVNGGSIALGHPLGSTGARLIVSALHELERRDAEVALVAMCCGGSHGTASLVRRR